MKKAEAIDKNIKALKRGLDSRRAELKEFDSKPASERIRLTKEGLNPHESKEVRTRKQDKIKLEERNKLRSNMSAEEWKEVQALGLFLTSEESKGFIFRRSADSFCIPGEEGV